MPSSGSSSSNPTVSQAAIKIDGAYLADTVMDKLLDLEVDTSLYVPTMFTLRFHDDKLDLVDGSNFALGKKVIVELPNPAQNNALVSVGEGEIVAISPEYSENFTMILTIRAYHIMHRLNRGTKSRVFLNQSDSDMVSKILQENGIPAGTVTSTTPTHKYVIQHNQTDMEFLHDRARRQGFELIGTPDGKVSFRAAQSDSAMVTVKWGQELRSFRPHLTGSEQVGSVEVRSWDVAQKRAITATANSTGASPSTGYGQGTASATKFGAAPKLIEIHQPLMTTAEATKLATSLLNEVGAGFLEAEGVAFGHSGIMAGKKVKIEKVGTNFSGTYVVSAATHRYSHATGYDTYFMVEGTRRRLMADLLDSQSSRHLPSVVQGVVTNNKDPDGMGRVKVKFPWLSEELESGWARVCMVGAGAQRGLYWMPEVNDEVLVAFEQGDMNLPYVLGGLYNGMDKPLDTADNTVKNSKVALYMLKTNTHTITIKDDSSDESIEIKDAGSKAVIKLTSKSSPAIDIKCTEGKITIEGGPQVEVKGKQIKVTAETALEMTGATVKLEASGNMTIKGAMVAIN
ncbi:MAG: VgrG-related protein [Anaerolineae bacterium]